MRPFDLREFSVPHPARLNPHLAGARERTKAWADAMGMLESGDDPCGCALWDEHMFDSQECALLCAYTHPDAPAERLATVSGWYAWVFFFDDHFLETCRRSGDLAAALRYVEGLRE